jgi:TolB protein
MVSDPLRDAIELVKAGKKKSARAQLLAILEIEPDNLEAWLWLTTCAANPDEYSRALREALRIDPTHPRARQMTIQRARQVLYEHAGRDFAVERAEKRHRSVQWILFVIFVVVLGGAFILAALRVLKIDFVEEPLPTIIPTLTVQQICQNELDALRMAVVARCSGLEAGQACLMNGAVLMERARQGIGDFTLPGDRMPVQDIHRLEAQPYRPGEGGWGLAWLRGVVARGGSLSVLLIGGANLEGVDSDFTSLTLFSAPKSVTCQGIAPAGLILQTRQQAHFSLNGLQVDLLGTAFIEAQAGGSTRYSQLDGLAEVVVNGQTRRLTSGEGVRISIDRTGKPLGELESQPANRPYLSTEDRVALAELAQLVGFETPWHEPDSESQVLAEATPESGIDPDLLVELASEVIVFSSERYGSSDIFLMDLNGFIKRLTDDPANDVQPALSPDGSKIVFSSDRNGSQDIYLLDLTDGTLTQITLNEGGNTYPTWSGNRLVFTSDRTGTPQLWMKDLTDGTLQSLTSAEGGVIQGGMSVEGVLAYSLLDGGIVIENAGETIRLDRAAYPAWSPDGTQLAYQSTRTGGAHIEIYSMADGTVRRLTSQILSGESQPTWNPAGTEIAFLTRRSGESELYVADIASGTVRHLAGGGITSPRWGSLSIPQQTAALSPAGGWQHVPAAVTSTLYDIDLLSPQYGLAVGENGAVLQYQDGVWGRMDLTPVQTAFSGERLTFYGVEVISESEAWAVGERGAIIHLVGGRWQAVPSPTQQTLYDIEHGWIVGANGVILRLAAGSGWELVDNPATTHLLGVSVANSDDVWVMGEAGTLLRWDGESWQRQLLPLLDNLNGLAGRWLANEAGLFDLESAESVALLNGELTHLLDVDAAGWAVGRDGAIIYRDGVYWSLLPKVTMDDLYAVDFPIQGEGWAVGEHGALLHYSLTPAPLEPVVPSPLAVDDPNALLKNWACPVLFGETFYEVELLLEPPAEAGQVLASMVIPALGNTVIAVDGEFSATSDNLDEDWSQLADSENALAWLTLGEAELLYDGTDGGYAPNGIFRLMLRQDGQVSGGIFAEDELVGEIPACQEIR